MGELGLPWKHPVAMKIWHVSNLLIVSNKTGCIPNLLSWACIQSRCLCFGGVGAVSLSHRLKMIRVTSKKLVLIVAALKLSMFQDVSLALQPCGFFKGRERRIL